VGDSVAVVARVVRAVQATPHLGGELSLLIGITGRKVSPCWRGDESSPLTVRIPAATRKVTLDFARSFAK
jgi:hypothetical protein